MPAASEYELIGRAIDLTLAHAEAVEADVEKQLETSAATPLVNALRVLTMQSTIVAIGSFSVFEVLLQQKKGWPNPFQEVDARLREGGKSDLADRLLDYRNAINVLKHGEGRSYEKLLARKDVLLFKVKDKDQAYFNEGDVAEGLRLVDADHAFVRQCSAVIDDVIATFAEDSL